VIRVEQSLDGQELGTPKSGRTRSVPMHPDVARVLAKLLERDDFTGQDDFVASNGTPLDGSAVRRRYVAAVKRAKLRPLRFHDLRHTFGTIAASAVLSGRELQEWMGHADLKTTARYLHYRAAVTKPDVWPRLSRRPLRLQACCKRTTRRRVPRRSARLHPSKSKSPRQAV
jgi:integrase